MKTKKISLLLPILFCLSLTSCNDKEYKKITKYTNVSYSIQTDTGKFDISWQNPEDTSDYKTWNIYLTGFYMSPSYISVGPIFYECLKINNNYDYYLYII